MWLSEWYENPPLLRMPRNVEEEREDLGRQDTLAVQGSRLRPARLRSGKVAGWIGCCPRPARRNTTCRRVPCANPDVAVAETHRCLVEARRMIRRRIREGHLFTFLEPPQG